MTNLAERLGFILSNQSWDPCVVQHPSDCHNQRFGSHGPMYPMFYLSPLPLWLIRHYNDIFEIWSYILNCQRNAFFFNNFVLTSLEDLLGFFFAEKTFCYVRWHFVLQWTTKYWFIKSSFSIIISTRKNFDNYKTFEAKTKIFHSNKSVM